MTKTNDDPAANAIREIPVWKSWRWRLARAIVIYLFVPYAAIVLIFTSLQRTFMYPATTADHLAADETSLKQGTIHELTFVANDGIELHGWLILAEGHSANTEQEVSAELNSGRKTVIYFPGNSGNRGERLADLHELSRRNLNVICFDYRGYGDNPGSPSESALIEDAWKVWGLATKQKSIPAGNLLLFGESLGGSVAIQTAARASREGTPPAALILSSTFLSMTDNVKREYPFFPVDLMLWDTWRSDRFAAEVDCPVLMFHGTSDEFVPVAAARGLIGLFPARAEFEFGHRWHEVKGGTHNDISPMLLKTELERLLSHLDQDP
ncbi:MAG TPA: alpha/beta hydrolase [Planctomycetaceae bacterium]|nr:alpha/beta hydrolase [Planctomycetaceae bacterium]